MTIKKPILPGQNTEPAQNGGACHEPRSPAAMQSRIEHNGQHYARQKTQEPVRLGEGRQNHRRRKAQNQPPPRSSRRRLFKSSYSTGKRQQGERLQKDDRGVVERTGWVDVAPIEIVGRECSQGNRPGDLEPEAPEGREQAIEAILSRQLSNPKGICPQ